jgi:hypothetical protein
MASGAHKMSFTLAITLLGLTFLVGIGSLLQRPRQLSMAAIAASMAIMISSFARGPEPWVTYVQYGGLVGAAVIIVAGFATAQIEVLRWMRIEIVLLFALILAIGASDSIVPNTSPVQRPLMFAEYGLTIIVMVTAFTRVIALFIRRTREQRPNLKAS